MNTSPHVRDGEKSPGDAAGHTSVLLQPALEGLAITDGDTFVDATLGEGGHSDAVCRMRGAAVHLVGIDLDATSLERARERIQKAGCDITMINGNFRYVDELLTAHGIERADRILFDLGWNSRQFESSGRGFSFRRDEPLLMTFEPEPGPYQLTAREIVNTWDEENLIAILKGYGEERFAKRIARGVIEAREEREIETSGQLAEIIERSIPPKARGGRLHPARRTFQALRITVNDEIEALHDALERSLRVLSTGGRMAVISFHSLEDRAVKRFMREKENEGVMSRVTKKPLKPSDAEIQHNPRSRSAKLRIAQKET